MGKPNIEIGKVIGAVGINGYLRINIFLSKINDIKEIGLIFFEKNELFFKLNLIRIHKGNAIVSINDIKDRTSAESLVGNRLFIKRSQIILLVLFLATRRTVTLLGNDPIMFYRSI